MKKNISLVTKSLILKTFVGNIFFSSVLSKNNDKLKIDKNDIISDLNQGESLYEKVFILIFKTLFFIPQFLKLIFLLIVLEIQ